MKPTAIQIRALSRADPVLGATLKRLGPFPGFPDSSQHRFRSHFHALARAVVFQAVSTKAASCVLERVVALTPGRAFPRPEQFLDVGFDGLRAVGLSGGKARAILALAQGVVDGSLPLSKVSRLEDEQIVSALARLPGIGEWTAQMFLIFRLGRLDVMPTGDLAVREGMRLLDGLEQRPTPRELRDRAEVWRPLRTVASWVLWELIHERERRKEVGA